jgi:aspartokinase
MITIPEIVEQIISGSPFLEDALGEGIINYSSLARKIKPEVERRLLKDVQLGAILMAIRRMSKKFKPGSSLKKIIHSNNDLIVRSNLFELVIPNTEFTIQIHEQLINLAEKEEQYFMTITEGVFETTIIASNDLYDQVKKIIPHEKITTELTHLSSITIHLPTSNVYSPGLYYFFLKALAWEGINVIEVVSTYTELTIVLDNKDVDRAFSVLKKLFSSQIT